MTEETTNTESSLPKQYTEQMSELQRMILDSQRELQQLRLDAKMDGLNIDSLGLLIQIRGRNLPDGGTKIFNDLVTYAISVGIEFDHVISQHPPEDVETQHITSIVSEEQRTNRTPQRRSDQIKLSAQLALGALLGAAMLWYLQ